MTILACTASFSAMALANDLTPKLVNAGDFSVRIPAGQFTITGALNQSGSFTSRGASFRFLPDGTGLDWKARIRDLVNAIPSDYEVRFNATLIAPNVVQWDMDATPNVCTTLNAFQVYISRISARFTFQLEDYTCAPDPINRLSHAVSVRMTNVGGNDGNFLRLEGYLFCQAGNSNFRIDANVFNLTMEGFSGGLPKSLGNVNTDCIVDDADLLAVLFAFGSSGSNLAEDTNGDEIVDDADLLTVLFNFGREG